VESDPHFSLAMSNIPESSPTNRSLTRFDIRDLVIVDNSGLLLAH
jgi:hypothetical protein